MTETVDFGAVDKLRDIISIIDAEKYPETCRVINEFLGNEIETTGKNLHTLADKLYDADSTIPMFSLTADYLIEFYETEIGSGSSEAANDLGTLYYTGRCGEQNYTKAVFYYTLAAERGNAAAQENLGYCYYYGRNVEKNYEKAFHFFALGAFRGQVISLYKIGDMYRNGYFVGKNEKEAFSIYEQCLNLLTADENPQSCCADVYMRMGDCLSQGIGTEENLNAALMFYQRAEQIYYQRISDGDFLIRKSCRHCAEAQEEVRRRIREKLPDFGWTE